MAVLRSRHQHCTQCNRVVRFCYGAEQEAVVYGQNVQQDLGRAKQVSDERYADLKDAAARRTQLGIQRPKLRETLRHWRRRFTRRKPA